MGKIIAIGGGEIGRPLGDGKGFYPIETTAIDKEIIRISGKKKPKLLLLPTASGDSEGYFDVVKKYFGERLGCIVDVLYLKKQKYSKEELRKRVLGSDIIYVGGGNTLNMLNLWKARGFDKIIGEAYDKGIVLSGVSAGAISWFRYFSSDSRPEMGRRNYGYIKCNGLDFIEKNLTLSPHHTREQGREKAIANIMKRTPGVGIALDDCSALEIVDGKYRIITSRQGARARKVYFSKGKVHYENIEKRNEFKPLEDLLNKK